MSYSDVFGSSAIQPSQVSYRAIAFSANTTLYWPSANLSTTDIVALWNDCTPSTTSLALTLPNATQVSVGTNAIFSNLGASTFTIKDSAGNTVTTVATTVVVYLVLASNSTAAGTWRVTTFGATTASSNAATLAGYGLTAITTTLNQSHPITSTSTTPLTLDTTYRAQTILWTGGAGTFNLPAAATAGNNFFFIVRNGGTGALVIDGDGSETIDGSTTFTLNATESCFVICSGTAWFTVGHGRTTSLSYTRLAISVAGSSNVTLTTAQAANIIQEYTGALTGNISVIVPTAVNIYYVYNNTSGAYTLTVKTAAGTGIDVTQGSRFILHCDGTNVVRSDTFTAAGVVTSVTGTSNQITSSGGTTPVLSIPATFIAPGSIAATTTVSGTNLIPTGSGVPSGVGAYLPSANFFAVATGGNYRGGFDSSGRWLIGPATALVFANSVTPQLQVASTSDVVAAIARYVASSTGAKLILAHSRGAAIGDVGALSTNDQVGNLSMEGHDGTNFAIAGQFIVSVGAAVSTGIVPGIARVMTTNTAGSSVERQRWDYLGNVTIGTAAIATNATDGFLYIPSCAGAYTGTPTGYTGLVPLVYDTTNHKLWTYYGGAQHFVLFT